MKPLNQLAPAKIRQSSRTAEGHCTMILAPRTFTSGQCFTLTGRAKRPVLNNETSMFTLIQMCLAAACHP